MVKNKNINTERIMKYMYKYNLCIYVYVIYILLSCLNIFLDIFGQ